MIAGRRRSPGALGFRGPCQCRDASLPGVVRPCGTASLCGTAAVSAPPPMEQHRASHPRTAAASEELVRTQGRHGAWQPRPSWDRRVEALGAESLGAVSDRLPLKEERDLDGASRALRGVHPPLSGSLGPQGSRGRALGQGRNRLR